MAEVGSSFFTVSDRPPLSQGGPELGPIVVWLRGEHDLSTDGALCLVLARAMALDCAGLVIDLSEVEFMACSTLGTVVRAREYLRQRSGWLTVRSPSVAARRVIDACNLSDLIEPNPEGACDVTGKALGSWVAVPAPNVPMNRPPRPMPCPRASWQASARPAPGWAGTRAPTLGRGRRDDAAAPGPAAKRPASTECPGPAPALAVVGAGPRLPPGRHLAFPRRRQTGCRLSNFTYTALCQRGIG